MIKYLDRTTESRVEMCECVCLSVKGMSFVFVCLFFVDEDLAC